MQLVCSDNVGTGKAELSLTVEDVSCTEVWLQISTRNSIHSRIVLTRDTVTLDTLILTTNEMTFVDENLLPSHRYVYTALLLDGGKSAQTIAETMDTTSHDFSWQIYTLGDGTGSSCLYDVAIINDTLAYAVGEIYILPPVGMRQVCSLEQGHHKWTRSGVSIYSGKRGRYFVFLFHKIIIIIK